NPMYADRNQTSPPLNRGSAPFRTVRRRNCAANSVAKRALPPARPADARRTGGMRERKALRGRRPRRSLRILVFNDVADQMRVVDQHDRRNSAGVEIEIEY